METIFEYAQSLVYTLLGLMPSPHQRSSLEAMLGLFLQAQGQAVPAHCTHKSASALSRFLNRYDWSTVGVIRATRQAMLNQILQHLPPGRTTLKVIIDLTTLPKCGKFAHLATVLTSEVGDGSATVQSDPWVRVLNGKRGLHLVMLYLVVGQWRVPWSFCIWHGKGHLSPVQLACKLLARVPKTLTNRFPVIVLADTEFGTIEFLRAVQKRRWRAVVGMRGNRQMENGKPLKQLYRTGSRGQQVRLVGMSMPLTVSWFWLKRSEGNRELRFVVSTYPYSGVYLVRLGRQRWAIEGFFKTIKHRFSLHRFGQSTLLGLYRWLVLSLVAFVLAHWIDRWSGWRKLDWRAASDLATAVLLPQVIWKDLLQQIRRNWDIAMQQGFEIVLKPIRWNY
jgi:Transposase DDE domain